MKTPNLFLLLVALLAFSCNREKDPLDEKKAYLETYKKEASELNAKIVALEKEIASMDPDFGKEQRKSLLVTTKPVETGRFAHYVEVTGSVLSKKNVNISAEVSGRIQEIKAVEGMRVNKGDLLAEIDAESIDNNIAEVEKQLELARSVFERQKRLWDQEIGTEMQFLEAKNRMEVLEKSLATMGTQKDRTAIRAPFDGTVEEVTVRLGELVQPGTPVMNFIGESDLYIEGDVSERYVGILSRGDSVEVRFPSLDRRLTTRITAVGGVIDPNNRTFKVEAYLPRGENVKPNMISVIKIRDYENKGAVMVPTYLILQDDKQEYVFTVENERAKKTFIKRGRSYDGKTEVLEGLKGDELLVDKGFREVGDEFKVNIAQL
ncbi:MAG TPA: efflux RND transporter periplasmic adaptor subunit [Cyclobacteriaceae bacterium]|nr:efflux RND transporter periplasmic adaptor subunit [Cyclobacteriaceae bacterium]